MEKGPSSWLQDSSPQLPNEPLELGTDLPTSQTTVLHHPGKNCEKNSTSLHNSSGG